MTVFNYFMITISARRRMSDPRGEVGSDALVGSAVGTSAGTSGEDGGRLAAGGGGGGGDEIAIVTCRSSLVVALPISDRLSICFIEPISMIM